MSHIIAAIIIGVIFWRAVFWTQRRLMHWVNASDTKTVEGHDRVRELAWWAAIGVISVFTVIAHALAQLFLYTL